MIKRQDQKWFNFLENSFSKIVNMAPLHFGEMTPARIPDKLPGVYLITAEYNQVEHAYYIGRSLNIRRRLYTNHLMGSLSNARLKKYLIESGECTDVDDAKLFIREKCLARWIEEKDVRKRGALEGYFTGLLFPKYGIYIEH